MHFPASVQPRARRIALGAATLAASGLIAACGGSSTTSTTTSASSAPTASRSAFVKCLQQHGVKPPPGLSNGGTRPTHPGAPPAGAGANANPTRQAAFKACGATGSHFNGG